MSRVLVVDDDPAQLDIRRLLLERAGHEVVVARSAAEALSGGTPEIVVLDLRLGRPGESFELIREVRRVNPHVKILVLSGWPEDLKDRAEESMVDAVIPKPARSERLLSTIARLAMLALTMLPAMAQKQVFPFELARGGEAVASIELASPGGNWAKPGAEASVADVRVDASDPFQIMVFSGDQLHPYRVFLGDLKPGPHRLSIERNPKLSAERAGLRMGKAEVEPAADPELIAHAPVLFARVNTLGKFSDVPLIVYGERLREGEDEILQYTVIFSNEDGGTSTRALMARWGRTTDIEYVYRLNRKTGAAIIQGNGHRDIPFQGRREDGHPLLLPVTDNNMVGAVDGAVPAGPRYQIAPLRMDLARASREQAMDEVPISYRVMGEELIREAKLRPFGTVDGEKISDSRNYVYLEAKVANRHSGVNFLARLKDDPVWRSSGLGRVDLAISRDGWIRSTIELPPGTRPSQIAEIGLECIVVPEQDRRLPLAGECRVDAVSKLFLLDAKYTPGASLWSLPAPVTIPTGQVRSYALKP